MIQRLFRKKSEIVWTAGTTPDPQKALSRALTEAAQLAGDFNTGSNYVASGLPKFKSIEEADFVIHSDRHVDIAELPDLSNPNIKTEVQNLVAALSRKNMEVFTVNITHPLLRIPAFYTIIPGAHFRERALGTGMGMFAAKLISEKNEPERAIPELKKMEHKLPGKYYIKFYLGTAHLSINDNETALQYYRQALDLDPDPQNIPDIYSYMGICLKEKGDYRKAIEILKKGESYDPDRTDIYNLMGFCHFKLGEHEKAIECFQQVIRLNPGSAIDYANIASNYRDMGEKEKAIQYYGLALMIDPSIDFARENLDKLMRVSRSKSSGVRK